MKVLLSKLKTKYIIYSKSYYLMEDIFNFTLNLKTDNELHWF